MTCEDCVHYELCKDEVEFHHGVHSDLEVAGVEKHCEYFKPKSRFVELPCEVGQTEELLQKAVNTMNSIDEWHRCWLCDNVESCDRKKYQKCEDFVWNGLKPTEKFVL